MQSDGQLYFDVDVPKEDADRLLIANKNLAEAQGLDVDAEAQRLKAEIQRLQEEQNVETSGQGKAGPED